MKNKSTILTILSPILLATLSNHKNFGSPGVMSASGNYTANSFEDLKYALFNGIADDVIRIDISGHGRWEEAYLGSETGEGFSPDTIQKLFAMLERFTNVESIKLKLRVTEHQETLGFGATSFDKLERFEVDFVTHFYEASSYKLDNSIFDRMPVLKTLRIGNVGLTSLKGLPKTTQKVFLEWCEIQSGEIPLSLLECPNLKEVELRDSFPRKPMPLNFLFSDIQFASIHSSDGLMGDFTISNLDPQKRSVLMRLLMGEGTYDLVPEMPEDNKEMMNEILVGMGYKYQAVKIVDLNELYTTNIRRF